MRSRSRFAIALALAAGLGAWLIWTSIGGSLETYTSPSGLVRTDHSTYRLNGRVNPGYGANPAEQAQSAEGLTFVVRDKDKPKSTVTVKYQGSVPDAFTINREVVVTGHMENGVFMADRGSLITLCPSKFMQKAADEGKTMPADIKVPAASQGK
jgi:cytochrome c-type biogenesis protein CcmE